MILLTVGTQLPFDRLVRAVDEWAERTNCNDVVAQIGPSDYQSKKLKCFQFLSPDEFRDLQLKADVMIGHAGMGSILTAMEFSKPIIIMPRDHERGEHRNGHQLSTAQRFTQTPGVYVAMDEMELAERLDHLGSLEGSVSLSTKAPAQLTQNLQSYIDALPAPRPRWRWLPIGKS